MASILTYMYKNPRAASVQLVSTRAVINCALTDSTVGEWLPKLAAYIVHDLYTI